MDRAARSPDLPQCSHHSLCWCQEPALRPHPVLPSDSPLLTPAVLRRRFIASREGPYCGRLVFELLRVWSRSGSRTTMAIGTAIRGASSSRLPTLNRLPHRPVTVIDLSAVGIACDHTAATGCGNGR